MPLPLAEEMYYETGDLGRYCIRVAGHCGCPPPHHWSKGSCKSPYVDSYHIDNDEALELFKLYVEVAKTWKWHTTYVPFEKTKDIRVAYTKRVMDDKYESYYIK